MRKVITFVSVLAVVSCCCALAQGQCSTTTATTGVNLCFPSAGATLLYPATFEFAATAESAAFTHVIVYDNGRKADDLPSLPSTLIDYSIKNGNHNIVINAWTSTGKLYQTTRQFTVIGYGIGSCNANGVGVTLCAPTGGLQPKNSVPVSFTAKGNATITAWKLYVDSVLTMSSSQTGNPNSLLTAVSVPAGSHNVTVVAWDKNGAVYRASRQFTAYYDRLCNVRTGTCDPGIVAFQPAGFGADQAADVSGAFTFEADVEDNPHPTTSMKVFLDG
ncbi:MAG TPA: Ig-like domain-containing protein, partial [Terriglobales bacterium]